MKKLTSLGIDLSTAATGLVLLEENGKKPNVLLDMEIKGQDSGISRNAMIVAEVMQVILAQGPSKIVIEGYSLNMKNASSVIPLVELGGLMRFMMQIEGMTWYDPRATEIKKFATGKGGSPKEVVMMNVFKRWEYESKTNNIADAYVCAAMGLAQANRLQGITLDMMAIAGQMKAVAN